MVFICVQLTITLVAVVAFTASMQQWQAPRAKYFIFLCLAVCIYTTGYLFELGAQSLEAAYIAKRIQCGGLCFIAPLFYLFIRDYTRRGVHGWRAAALFVLPCVTLALACLYPASTLFFRDITFTGTPAPCTSIDQGFFAYLHIAYSIAFLAGAVLEVLRFFPRRNPHEKRQAAMFLLAACLPMPAFFLLLTDRMPIPMGLASSALAVCVLILLHYVAAHRLQDWLPYAREQVVESMSDGFVLIDGEYCYIDANQVAKEYFPVLRSLPTGASLGAESGFPGELLRGQNSPQDVCIRQNNREKVLRVSTTRIAFGAKAQCTCILFYDVTELHQLMGELQELATHDGLTGLLNRATFFRLARHDFDLALRAEQDTAVLMLDIDHFKAINDHYGHQCGDEVLRQLANILQNRLRRTDICGRYGGEEFCILLPGAGENAALMMAELIREAVGSHRFCCGEDTFPVTVSIGVARRAGARHSCLEALINDADSALYAAKHNGRNRVVAYSAAMEAGALAPAHL